MAVELAFIQGTSYSIGVALSFASISLLLFTGNMYLMLMSLIAMVFIITAMLAYIVLAGWTLGAVEAVCISIVVGLSVDYSLHLGHAYTHAGFGDRKGRVKQALEEVGGSLLAAALTSMGAMAVLCMCTIWTFVVMGSVMLLTLTWAILISLCTLTAALTLVLHSLSIYIYIFICFVLPTILMFPIDTPSLSIYI